MTLSYSERFLRSYAAAPAAVRAAFDKQASFLLQDLRHPSLRAKKYDQGRNLWQARVTRGWRLYFSIETDTYRLHDIMTHPK